MQKSDQQGIHAPDVGGRIFGQAAFSQQCLVKHNVRQIVEVGTALQLLDQRVLGIHLQNGLAVGGLLAGLLETGWAIGLKYSEGFTRPLPSALTIAGALGSFWLLSLAMKELPVGTAYAVWVGIGAVGTAVTAVILFNEPVSAMRVAGILLILGGIVALKLA